MEDGVKYKAENREIKWKSNCLLNSEIRIQKMETDINLSKVSE